MRLILGSISARRTRGKSGPADLLVEDYIARAARMVSAEAIVYPAEAALLEALPRTPARPAAALILFDSRGELLTSEAFAERIGRLRDTGTQRLMFAVGGADGWTAGARTQARHTVSFGRMTLPHELARAVAAEQIYRALTILAGHPYHGSHL